MLKLPTIRTLAIGTVVFVTGAVILGTAGIAGWEYSNSNYFCATTCHAVHPEEPYAHETSHHANVDCVECHWTHETGGNPDAYFLHAREVREQCARCHSEFEEGEG